MKNSNRISISVVLKVRLFVLVSPENDVSNITQIADELRNVVSKPIMIDDKPFPLTLSIGISYDEGKKPRLPALHCSQCNGFYSQKWR